MNCMRTLQQVLLAALNENGNLPLPCVKCLKDLCTRHLQQVRKQQGAQDRGKRWILDYDAKAKPEMKMNTGVWCPHGPALTSHCVH